jgi:NAD(P)-dependent dehydrogenase (short-subunit alcohol dehydrogenase family)
VNAVAPGYTYTAMTAQTLDSEAGKKILDQVPMKRAATVEEIANAVLFLASDAASFVTGHILVVDGGRTVV